MKNFTNVTHLHRNKITAKNGYTRPKRLLHLVAIKRNTCSIFRIFEKSDKFPWPVLLLASFILACIFIVRVIIMNLTVERDVRIFYLSNKFGLNRFANNLDLLSDRKK